MCHVNRESLTHCSQGSVAQLVEQQTSNPKVVGSNPTWATEFFNNSVGHYQCRLSSLMGPYLLGKRTSCWWRHETMRNIYCVEFNSLNLKCYVLKMFLPNFNRIEWKMEKQQLFQNMLFLALFILTWEKYDVIMTSLLIWFGFFSS